MGRISWPRVLGLIGFGHIVAGKNALGLVMKINGDEADLNEAIEELKPEH